MNTKIERNLIEQCAPTLAGIKVGSLFKYYTEKKENMNETILFWNNQLLCKGIMICTIRNYRDGGLIYVFRPSMLEKLLSDAEIKEFLSENGYKKCRETSTYVDRLKQQMKSGCGFPHEIGIFLGYPLSDVKGFIENKGKNFNLCGAWKVYDKGSLPKGCSHNIKNAEAFIRQNLKAGPQYFNSPWLPDNI